MNDYTLSEVFDTVYGQEFSEFVNPPKHFFSRRHRKAMKEILYPPTVSIPAANRKVTLKNRVIIALLVILLSALGITAGAAISRGFTRKENRDNTELFAVNAENAPKTIEYVYYLPSIPDGYKLYEQNSDSDWVHSSYIDLTSRRTITLDQDIKEGYNIHFDNERNIIEKMEVKGKYALYYEDNGFGTIVWDNEDYVLKISGHFTKDELIAFAENVEIKREQPQESA